MPLHGQARGGDLLSPHGSSGHLNLVTLSVRGKNISNQALPGIQPGVKVFDFLIAGPIKLVRQSPY
ncbi:MAG: hypothetical protein U5K56_21235 [Halioglobus sp.]|nr:hypothetical protein [Halioglobus sp.]